ncbi:MAG: hypothetical protein DRJ10_00680 [Bacteroidetes bacterium]|nr:MAG: hypothetical protein DRI89_02080 [Bacteroidota bacterium]RLD84613.1 MAG: hypothetical protein DRJ10_00680 [Bacteroidota bacterium]
MNKKVLINIGKPAGLAHYGLSIASELIKADDIDTYILINKKTLDQFKGYFNFLSNSKKIVVINNRVFDWIKVLRLNPRVIINTSGIQERTFFLFNLIMIRSKKILYIHETEKRQQKGGEGLEDRIMSFFTKKMYRIYYVHGANMKSDLVKKGYLQSKISIVDHGIYDFFDRIADKKLEEKFSVRNGNSTILFFGELREDKGLDQMEKIYELVSKNNVEFNLVIAGKKNNNRETNKGDWNKRLDLILDNLRKKSNVFLFDYYIPDSAVAYLFRNTDILILPYNSATQSGVLLTGLYFNTIPVAYNVGELNRIIKNNTTGFIVEKDNIDDFVDSVVKLLKNRELLSEFKSKLSENNKNHLTWKMVCKTVVRDINQLVKN